MLFHFKKIILPCLLVLGLAGLQGQSTITFVEDFNNLGCNTLAGCNITHSSSIITPTCLPGGGTSHGTPHIGSSNGDEYAQLGGSAFVVGGSEEGIFLGFQFNQGVEYTITLRVKTFETSSSNPQIMNTFAANGLTHNVDCPAGSPPLITSFQNIDMTDVGPADRDFWTDFVVTLCADDDYSQFWVFPTGPYVLLIDEVTIEYEACDPSAIFTGTIPTFYQTDGNIRTLSAGPFNAANNPNKVTHYKAEDFILLEHCTFISAAANTNNYFLAEITPCEVKSCSTGGSSRGKARMAAMQQAAPNNVLSIYPNPSNSHFRIKIGAEGFVDEGNYESGEVKLSIIDNMGRTVYQRVNHPLTEAVRTDDFNNGMYTVTVRKDGVLYTQKVLIRH